MPNAFIQSAKQSAKGMEMVETLTDADIAEVKGSAKAFEGVESAIGPLDAFLRLFHALRWVADEKDKLQKAAIELYLDNQFGNFVDIAAGRLELEPPTQEQLRLTLRAQEDEAVQRNLLRKDSPEKGKLYPVFYDLFLKAQALLAEEGFLNWEVAFPGVWQNWDSRHPSGGFDAVIGNPPWDRMKLQEVEWFAARKPEIAKATRASDRKKMIAVLEKAEDPLWRAYERASWHAETAARRARKDGQYPLLSAGDINLYSLFVERAHRLVKPTGMVGLLTPSGIAADKSASRFFKKIATEGRLAGLFDFENKKVFFPDIHASFKFCTYIAGGAQRTFAQSDMAFFLHAVEEMSEPERVFPLTAEDFARVNPNTGTAPIFRNRRDAEITRRIYERFPVLNDHAKEKVWPVRFVTMFHMTNDSALFKTRAELEQDGFYPVAGNRLKKGDDYFVPLYEGKMVQSYDHRAASITINPQNVNRPAQPQPTVQEQYAKPSFLPTPQFYVSDSAVSVSGGYFLGFKDVTAPTNFRSMIAAIIPRSGVGNTLPLIVPETEDATPMLSLYLANLNSFAFDYVCRQKIQGQHLNWYIVEQLPIVSPEQYKKLLGKTVVADFVKDHVLHLTYTAWDMQPFAKDLGYDGDPFVWDEEDRRHRRAKLDALFFNLYGVSEDDADYILSTFPIVRRQDEKAFGRYLTRDLVLAYMRALEAGDTDVTVQPKANRTAATG